MPLALGRGRGRGVPIHDTWRREHNIWARGWAIRIPIRIRGRRIIPCIGTGRGWIGCTGEGLGRVLGKRRWVGCLFSPSGSRRLFLVAAHEIVLSGVENVLGWHGEGDGHVARRLRRTWSARLVEQGEDGGKKRKRGRRTSAVVVRDFKISSPLRLSWRQCTAPPQFRELACFDCNRSSQDLSSKTTRWGSPAGDDDVDRRDGAMPVHV